MDDKELIALQDRYKNALLYKQEAKIHNLYEQLSKEKIGSEDFFHQAEQWAAECHELAKKAIEAVLTFFFKAVKAQCTGIKSAH